MDRREESREGLKMCRGGTEGGRGRGVDEELVGVMTWERRGSRPNWGVKCYGAGQKG